MTYGDLLEKMEEWEKTLGAPRHKFLLIHLLQALLENLRELGYTELKDTSLSMEADPVSIKICEAIILL